MSLPAPVSPGSLWVRNEGQAGVLVEECFRLEPGEPVDLPVWVVRVSGGDVMDVTTFLATHSPS